MAGVCCLFPRNRHTPLIFHVSENEIYKRSDVLVVGVSSDPVEKQKAFVERNKLPVKFLLKIQVLAVTLIGYPVSCTERYRPSRTQSVPNWSGDVGTD